MYEISHTANTFFLTKNRGAKLPSALLREKNMEKKVSRKLTRDDLPNYKAKTAKQ